MLADLKQFWRFAGAVEAENKEHQIAGEGWKTGSKKKKDVPAEKKVALDSTSKVAYAYDVTWYILKEKLRNLLLLKFTVDVAFFLTFCCFHFKMEFIWLYDT